MNTLKKILITLGIIIFGIACMLLLGSTKPEANKRDIPPPVRQVQTASVIFSDQHIVIKGSGIINSRNELDIHSEVNGQVTYAKNHLRNGTYTEQDETLLEVDSRETRNDLYALRAGFLNVISSFLPHIKLEDSELFNKWNQYYSSLSIQDDIPELPAITSQREKLQVSTYNIFSQFYKVKNAELYLDKHRITAPFTGFITSESIVEGTLISPGTPLLTLRDVHHLEIAVPLLLEDYNWIDFDTDPSAKIYLDDQENQFVTGKIIRRDTHLTPDSQTLNVYISFENPELIPQLYPGNFVQVAIEGRLLSDVASIPRSIVFDQKFIYVYDEGKLARQEIRILALLQETAIIAHSIPDETILVTTVLQKPLIGMLIEPLSSE